jgi:hypothetical protein
MASPAPTITARFDWTHSVKEIGGRGLDIERVATKAERDGLEQALDVLSFDHFETAYRVVGHGSRRYTISGTFKAKVSQACVITLDTVYEAIDETFSVGFNPPERSVTPSDVERPVLDEPDIEIFVGETLEIGRVLYELLAAAIDPYPRAAGAEFSYSDRLDAGDQAAHAFAALAKLKNKP